MTPTGNPHDKHPIFQNGKKMIRPIALMFSLVLALLAAVPAAEGLIPQNGIDRLTRYNVAWDSPGERSINSMPLGNGDIGLNVWADKNGDVLIYISKTDAFDNMNRLVKLGRIRLSVSPNPFTESKAFHQTLHLSEAKSTVRLGSGDQEICLMIWVDANHPVIRMEVQGKQAVTLRAQLELWRKERELPEQEVHYLSPNADKKYLEHPDTVLPSGENVILWHYRNQGTTVPALVNRTFGGLMQGAGMKKAADNPQMLVSVAPGNMQRLVVYALTAQTQTPEEWTKQIRSLAEVPYDPGKAWEQHKLYWNNFWNRSWIFADSEKDKTFEVTQGYILSRFMLACASRGAMRNRFNGSIFSCDFEGRAHPGIKEDYAFNADYRLWGGKLYWWQNTRWLYWPLLASGDFDLMQPFFQVYTGPRLKKGIDFMKNNMKYDGAAVFHELSTLDDGAFRINADWEAVTKYPTHDMNHCYYQIMELASMMLDYVDFTGDTQFRDTSAVPVAAAGVRFYNQHFRKNPEKKFVLYPVGCLETYSGTTDAMPELAGLQHILDRLLVAKTGTAQQRQEWEKLRSELPPLPTRVVNGKAILSPAKGDYGKPSNIENPELYALFPFRMLGVGRPDLDLARRNYAARRCHLSRCWGNDSIDAACVGDSAESAKNIIDQFTQGEPRSKFPACWRANNDWLPDMDNGGGGMVALQYMLLQSVNDKIYLLPAWPREWNVSFKLHTAGQTTVAVDYRNGKVVSLEVKPAERKKDIILPEYLR